MSHRRRSGSHTAHSLFLAVFVILAGAVSAAPGLVVAASGLPPEITGLTLSGAADIQWNPDPFVDGYHLYRGLISGLDPDEDGTPNSYGSCLQASLTLPGASDPAVPAPGETFLYLATAAKGFVESILGQQRQSGAPVLRPFLPVPCITPPGGPRLSQLNPNGLQLDGVVQGVAAPRNPGLANDLTGLAGGGVYLHTGEYFVPATDLEIPGRGISWKLERFYRSQISYDGPLGFNWTHNYDRRIRRDGADLIHLDGHGREQRFVPAGGGLFLPAQDGLYVKIREHPGGFTVRERDGTLFHHHAAGAPLFGQLERIEDRHGNVLSFLYHANGILSLVVDTLGRTIVYFHDVLGRLTSVVDFNGREVKYEYDNAGDLVSVRRPVVTGTSTSNNFPLGKTIRYGYDATHNLVSITAPGDAVPVIQNVYDALSDELIQQTHGGLNASGVPAGGVYTYAITTIGGGFREIIVQDRNGILHRFETDPAGHLLIEETLTVGLRPSDPPLFQTFHNYNIEGERVSTLFPLGNQILYQYDSFNTDIYQRGNLLLVRRVPDPVRADGHGGLVPPDIVVTYVYEPLYTQMRIIRDPHGRDSVYIYDYQEDPLFGWTDLALDWQINMGGLPTGLGDVNGDGLFDQLFGSPVVLDQPTVTVRPGGLQDAIAGPLQSIRTRYRYDALGQLGVEIDPEGNVKTFAYHPEIDPDGNGVQTPPPPDGRLLDPASGGYLAISIVDDDPTLHLTPSELAARDNGTNPPPAQIKNEYLYNLVGDLISSIDGNNTRTAFEVNQLGQIVRVTRAAGTTNANFSTQVYNARDEIIRRTVQVSPPSDRDGDGLADTSIFNDAIHDMLGNVVETAQGASSGGAVLPTLYRYDKQGNRTATVFPEGNRFTLQYDERELLLRLVRGDSDLDASNGGPPGASANVVNYDWNGNPESFEDGNGGLWPFIYDGFDRRTRSEIVPGTSFFDVFYEVTDEIAGIKIMEGPVERHTVFYIYDALGRFELVRQSIRDSSGTPILEDADLDGFTDSVNEYDRNSRRTRVVADSGRIETYFYDGAGRLLTKADPIGNEVFYVHDANNNLVEILQRDLAPVGFESFTTIQTYDALNRMTKTTDANGHLRVFEYDSRDNLVRATDTMGNVVTYAYDAMDRRVSIDRELRLDGTGDGAVFDHIINGVEYDGNGRATAHIDAEGHRTTYDYDDLDRPVTTVFADGSQTTYTYDDNDNVIAVLDANGSLISIHYDVADRPFQKVAIPGLGVEDVIQNFTYDALNRLTEATNQNPLLPGLSNTVFMEWDSLNRLRSETTVLGDNPGRTSTFSYDGNGNRTQAIFPSGNTIDYTYDALDRLEFFNDTTTGFNTFYTYMGPDRVAERIHGNGTRMSHLDPFGLADLGYDPGKRVVGRFHYDALGGGLAGFEQGLDREGNLVSEARLHDGAGGDVWRYDSAYRLVEHLRGVADPVLEQAIPGAGGPIARHVGFRLDRVGNILERDIQDTVTGIFGLFANTPNNLNEYGEKPDDGLPDDFNDDLGTPLADGVNLAHDAGGNLRTKGTRSFTYDVLSRLLLVDDALTGSVQQNIYDALNRRVARLDFSSGVAQRFVHDDRVPVEIISLSLSNVAPIELAPAGALFWGIESHPVAAADPVANLFYLHEDGRGNVVMATDSVATIVERITYDAFGIPEFQDPTNVPSGLTESLTGNPFLYGGRHWDAETQLYEDHGAIFDPELGRHLQRFPPGNATGPLGQALNPPLVFPTMTDWIGMNPFWWWRAWFWVPGFWWAGRWAWKTSWWWGGMWGWWWWQPWLWFGMPTGGWWILKPWHWWWGAPYHWWGWHAWWRWPGWWGWWPWWGWWGWGNWLPVWGWLGWCAWWPWWGWRGWVGWWPWWGWWGWCGWWPWWNTWWSWQPAWWWGWWTWRPWWWASWWGWSGLTWWWNWWCWTSWWPWSWWYWAGWWPWWGWGGWNPWWFGGWWSWWRWTWLAGWGWWWWGPIGWRSWFWGWIPWWWCGSWIWLWWHGWWHFGWFGFWHWRGWWTWWWGWWSWPWWGRWRWWGWWWPWWGWWG